MRATPVSDLVLYPESDGKPMAETEIHWQATVDATQTLSDFFESDPTVYVASDNFVYWVEGNPKRCVSPDVYVVKGVSKRVRRVFKVWEEAVPCFVLEITSRKTRREDLGSKMSKYRDDLRVPEYFLFDPEGEWIEERLRGFRLEDDVYVRIELGPTQLLRSIELGLELGLSAEGKLQFWWPDDGRLMTRAERIEYEREAREHAEARAAAAEDEVRRLKAELARVKGSAKRKKR